MPAKSRFDAGSIRRLARQRVEQSSLRAVAEEIGISKSGLDSFLKGRDPYSKTRAKLAVWSARLLQQGGGAIQRADVEAAIALLELYLTSVPTETVRARRVREVAARLFHPGEVDAAR